MTDDRPSQRARQRDETRQRLLEAATEAFVDTGPATTPVAAVAARAGVSIPTLFFHFGNRLGLLDAAAQHLLHKWLLGRRSAAPDLRTFMERYLRAQHQPEVRLLWQLIDVLHADRPEHSDAAYWATVAAVERRLADGHERDAAHRVAQVIASGLMVVARRLAFGYAGDTAEADFVAEASDLAKGPVSPTH